MGNYCRRDILSGNVVLLPSSKKKEIFPYSPCEGISSGYQDGQKSVLHKPTRRKKQTVTFTGTWLKAERVTRAEIIYCCLL